MSDRAYATIGLLSGSLPGVLIAETYFGAGWPKSDVSAACVFAAGVIGGWIGWRFSKK